MSGTDKRFGRGRCGPTWGRDSATAQRFDDIAQRFQITPEALEIPAFGGQLRGMSQEVIASAFYHVAMKLSFDCGENPRNLNQEFGHFNGLTGSI